MLVWNALLRVVKGQQTSGEIRPCISFEFENDWVRAPFDPNFAPNNSFDAIINLTADDAVMNAKSHTLRLKSKVQSLKSEVQGPKSKVSAWKYQDARSWFSLRPSRRRMVASTLGT